MSQRAMISVFLMLASVGGAWVARAEETAKVTLKDLTWMVGDWRAEVNGDQLQEIWSGPLGDSMVGMFRWVNKDGKVTLFELLTITDDEGQIAFRFRHFGRAMVAWEEKDAPLTFKMTRATDRELTFENPDQKQLLKLTYRRDGNDKYSVLIEGSGKDGKTSIKEFRFTRAKNTAP